MLSNNMFLAHSHISFWMFQVTFLGMVQREMILCWQYGAAYSYDPELISVGPALNDRTHSYCMPHLYAVAQISLQLE